MESLIPNSIFEKAVLLDSGVLYALTDKRDQYHQSAKNSLIYIQKNKLPIFVTNIVIIEAYRLILNNLGKDNAQKFLKSILNDIKNGAMKVERVSEYDEKEGQKYIFEKQGYSLTLTDTINFSVMFRMGIYQMFGFDRDCLIFGFKLFSIKS